MEDHERLEREVASWAGVRNVVACSSGTAALHLALEALGLPAASPVVVPDWCMVAVPRAVMMAGLRPILCDVGDDGNLDPELAVKAVAERNARACIVVHTYGRTVDMRAFAPLLDRGVALIEDLAEAHGVRPHPDSTAACWSFYRNKIVAGEEGGAVAFEVPRLATRARRLRCLGFTDAHDFNHVPRGHNYRLAPTLARLVLKALDDFGTQVRSRWDEWERWERAFEEMAVDPSVQRKRPQVPWVFEVRLPGLKLSNESRTSTLDKLVAVLRHQYGVEARHGFKRVKDQPEFQGCQMIVTEGWEPSRSADLALSTFYLPLTGTFSRDCRKQVAGLVQTALEVLKVNASTSPGGRPPGPPSSPR